jgi:hypothetical protein
MSYIGKSPSGSGVRTRYYFTQTSGGGTSISGTDDNGKTLTYTDGEYMDVYLNGVLLVHGTDYGTGTANTISSLAALASGDVVEVVVYDIFNVAKINNEAVRKRYYKTASGSETSISGADDSGATITFPANAEIEVKLNGVALVQGTDYNTTTANTVGGLSALSAGQVVEVVVYERFVLGDTVSKADGGTFGSAVAVNGDLTVDTDTLHVDASANVVRVGKTSGGVTTDGWQLSAGASHYAIPSGQYFILNRTTSGAATMIDFRSENSSKGGITYNGTNVSFTSGSNNVFNQSGISFDNGSNYLDDYEEGTWTPDLGSSVGSSSEFGKYTKVGNTVFIQGTLNVASNTNGNHMQITNFPFTGSGAQGDRGGFFIRYTDYGDVFWLHFNGSNTTTGVYTKSGGALTYANMSGKRLDFAGFYSVP